MDIGGGSLELIRFQQGTIEQALSLQLGAVRLTERFIHDRDAALSNQTVAAITAHVQQQLTDSGFSFAEDAGPMIVTGGAFTVTRAVLAAQAGMTIDAHCAELLHREIAALKDKLIHLPLHDRMAVPQLPVSRADIIPAALITIDTVLNVAQRNSVTHSFYNLRYGIAAELLGR
jgi:exopolyphosphatase/guanosine-5'-triphosphate,3'-diphosphate pyrophosphatase